MITNKGDIIMKRLLVLFAMLITFLSCSSITEPIEKPLLSGVYTLPYYRHYDGDAQFVSDNPIDTTGVICEIRFFAYNFVDTTDDGRLGTPVHYKFFISQNYQNRFINSDTLYFSPYLSTEDNTEFTVVLNKNFDGLLNIHINRYETFKPIDFRCEILYLVKN
jgi:hypothetical protein